MKKYTQISRIGVWSATHDLGEIILWWRSRYITGRDWLIVNNAERKSRLSLADGRGEKWMRDTEKTNLTGRLRGGYLRAYTVLVSSVEIVTFGWLLDIVVNC